MKKWVGSVCDNVKVLWSRISSQRLSQSISKLIGSTVESRARRFVDIVRQLNGDGLAEVLTRGAAGAFVLKVAGAGLGFGVHVLLARLLEVTDYGIYLYAYTWVGMLVLLGRMGMDKGFLRFIPEYRANQQWGRLHGVLRFGTNAAVAASISVAALAVLVVWSLRELMPPGQAETFWIAFALIPIWTMLWLFRGALRGLKHVVRALAPEQVLKHVLIGAGAIGLYYLLGHSLSAQEAMTVTFLAMALTLLVLIYLLYGAIPKEVREAPVRNTPTYWLRITLPMVFIAGMHVVMSKTDIIMIGAFIGPDATGIYGAAVRVASLVVFGLSAVNIIAAPLISELFHTGQRDRLNWVVTWSARGTFVVATVLTIGLIVFGDEVLSLFGVEFRDGYTALLILLIGQMVNAFAGSVGFVMTMTGHQDKAAFILGVCAVANVGLNVVLVPIYGMAGGAAATTLTLAGWNVWMIYHVVTKMNINPTIFRMSKTEAVQRNEP